MFNLFIEQYSSGEEIHMAVVDLEQLYDKASSAERFEKFGTSVDIYGI